MSASSVWSSEVLPDRLLKVGPCALKLLPCDCLNEPATTVRIVELQDRRLVEDIGRAGTRRVVGIALNLDWPTVERCHEQ